MSRQAGLFYRTSLFEEVTINLPDRKTFVIRTHNNSKTNKYIESVLLNGKPLDVPFFTHNDIVRGGTMEITMSSVPTEWGKQIKNKKYNLTQITIS